MKIFHNLLATAIVTTSIFATTVAQAETYRAGEFTITLDEVAEYGRTYYGCDDKGNCLRLNHGTRWRDNGYRGITWENGEYYYSISWKEGETGPMYLSVVKGGTRLLYRPLVPVR